MITSKNFVVEKQKLKRDEVKRELRQQLKAARARKRAFNIIKESHKFYEQNDVSDYENLDDHVWSDKDINEKASDYFAVLQTARSKRTQRRKKAELKKAAQNTRSITTYLASALTCSQNSHITSALTSTCESSTESYALMEVKSTKMEAESMEVESMEMESTETKLVEIELLELELMEVESTAGVSAEMDIDEKTKMWQAIEELDRMLKNENNHIDKGVKWRKLLKDNRSRFTKVSSLLDDERISMKIMSYLRSHKFSVNPRILKEYVENEHCKEWRKDIYVDGHECKDVVHYRQTIFLPMMKELEPVLLEYDDKDLTKLVEKNILSEKKNHCVVTHDETTLAANDDKKTGWGPKGEHKLRLKGWGRCIHISEFLCEPLGRVHLTAEQFAAHLKIPNQYVTELLEIGVNYEGYWNVQMLAKQLERAIDILEIALPDMIFVFGFDNSSSHGAFAEDALIVSRMNVGYGGKQPKMRPGQFFDGIKEVMTERGIWNKQLRGKYIKYAENEEITCCNMRKLARQPDFMEQKNVLKEIVLNRVKRYARSHYDYTFQGLRKTVPEALDSVNIITIRKFARKVWRYMDAYRKGLTPSAAEFAVKKYKSHRRIPKNIEL
ncbi:6477_t:CDS:10 [Scutellospora calospora]|uniref:6477_t:CDS:1 n=1 Tax=Scutellospora calospora TaxID=85575 RepID=A0ACA9JUD4_9GLOM|nr:6477_t:CDS:10 [Scutellospora calospora]